MTKIKITIIEDDDDLRGLVRGPLQAAGYEVVGLRDGNTLFERVENMAHLFILDLDLRGISGLDICRRLKSQERNAVSPVVFIISANPDIRQLAAEVCADDILAKPFTIKELLEKISRYYPEATVVR